MTSNDDWFSAQPPSTAENPMNEWWDGEARPAIRTKRRSIGANTRARLIGGGILAGLLAVTMITGALLSDDGKSGGTGTITAPDDSAVTRDESGGPESVSDEVDNTTEDDGSADDLEQPPAGDTAQDLLNFLPVKGRAPRTDYDRTGQFGQAWLDVDRNGCDTRNDILRRDLDPAVISGPCKVTSGSLNDPFTGMTIQFVRGHTTSTLVQIDHVVALSNAWQTGAQQMSQEKRVAFANDPLNLLAVDGAANQQKSDGDAATWLPPQRSFWCEYVARQISVKATYDLWVTPAEFEAMTRILASCPAEPAVSSHQSVP